MGSEETELVLAHLLAIANKSENVPHAAELLPATEFLYRQLDGQNSRPQPLTTLGYALAQLGSVLTAWESAGQLSPANTNALHTVWCNLCMAAEHAHEHVNTRYLNMELQLEVRRACVYAHIRAGDGIEEAIHQYLLDGLDADQLHTIPEDIREEARRITQAHMAGRLHTLSIPSTVLFSLWHVHRRLTDSLPQPSAAQLLPNPGTAGPTARPSAVGPAFGTPLMLQNPKQRRQTAPQVKTAPRATAATPASAPRATAATPASAPRATAATPASAPRATAATPASAPRATAATPASAPRATSATPASAPRATAATPASAPQRQPLERRAASRRAAAPPPPLEDDGAPGPSHEQSPNLPAKTARLHDAVHDNNTLARAVTTAAEVLALMPNGVAAQADPDLPPLEDWGSPSRSAARAAVRVTVAPLMLDIPVTQAATPLKMGVITPLNTNTPGKSDQLTPRRPPRRTNAPFSEQETEFLRDQVTRYYRAGRGAAWVRILQQGRDRGVFFLSRTSVDLKDKWRNMWKKAEKAQREKQPDQVVHLYSTRTDLEPLTEEEESEDEAQSAEEEDADLEPVQADQEEDKKGDDDEQADVDEDTVDVADQQDDPGDEEVGEQSDGVVEIDEEATETEEHVQQSEQDDNAEVGQASKGAGDEDYQVDEEEDMEEEAEPVPTSTSKRGSKRTRGRPPKILKELPPCVLDQDSNDDQEDEDGGEDGNEGVLQSPELAGTALPDTYAEPMAEVETQPVVAAMQPVDNENMEFETQAVDTGTQGVPPTQPATQAATQAGTSPAPLVQPRENAMSRTVRSPELEAAGERPAKRRQLPGSFRGAAPQQANGDNAAADDDNATPSGAAAIAATNSEEHQYEAVPSRSEQGQGNQPTLQAPAAPAAGAGPSNRPKPSGNYRRWTDEDVEALIVLVGKHGTHWGLIHQDVERLELPGLYGRTWQQMFDKWRSICKKTGMDYERARRIYEETILND